MKTSLIMGKNLPVEVNSTQFFYSLMTIRFVKNDVGTCPDLGVKISFQLII